METNNLELLAQQVEFMKKDFNKRIEALEQTVTRMNKEEQTLSTSIVKIEGLLEHIVSSMDRLENSTKENFNLVHDRISSVKDEFELSQKRELDSYTAYKKIIIGAVLTAIVGGLMGAVLTSYRMFGN